MRAISSDLPAEDQELCPRCRGAGYLVFDVPYGHPDFGHLQACNCRIAQVLQQRLEHLHAMSNIGPFRDKTFDNFDAGVPGVTRALARARAFAEHPAKWLVLMGNYGCGKTHLAAAIANAVLSQGYEVLFAVVPDLLDHLRSTFGPNSEVAYDERFEQIRGAYVLILDDFGTENATPWAREKLYQIFNHRYNYRMPTVITTNRKPEEIEPRILSRMSDPELCDEIILIDAEDYRKRSRGQRFEHKKQDHLRRMGRRDDRGY